MVNQMTSTLTMNKNQSHSYDQQKIKMLCDATCERIEDLLDFFEIEYKHNNSSMVSMCCPIHNGDNPSALNIYHEGDNYRGNWKCRTHGCEKVFRSSIIGFIRGVLSTQKYNWTNEGDQTCSFREAVDFATKFVGKSLDQYHVDKDIQEKKQFAQIIQKVTEQPDNSNLKITRQQARNLLQIPAQYYLDRGYSAEILNKYDVGLCDRPNKEMSNRVVAPIYDYSGNFVVGCTGRSVFNKCDKCLAYHDTNEDCPREYAWQHSKWRHSSGLKTQNCLYNIWFAKEYIQNSGTVILVESPGNVWRLEENGIHNSVAIFGTTLSDRQKIILDSSGAMNVVVLMDNDDAGITATKKIIEKCNRTYQIHVPTISKNDIGDMNSEEIDREIKKFMEKIV
jgi:5S rRNA maturation endonuclease (ribonuclease M5)